VPPSVRSACCITGRDLLLFLSPDSGSARQSSHVQRTDGGRWEGRTTERDSGLEEGAETSPEDVSGTRDGARVLDEDPSS
jgi:hypothetical protein